MKLKKIMPVALVLLAILTIGAVSAVDENITAADMDVLSQDLNDGEAVSEYIAGDDAEDVLSYNASDFNVKINESMDLDVDGAAAVTFDVPSDAEGEIWIYPNYYKSILAFDLDRSPLTLDDLFIDSAGSYYSINVTFVSAQGDETFLASGTIEVTGTKTITADDFYGKKSQSTYTSIADTEIFALEDCPADGTIIAYVDGNQAYAKSISAGNNISISDIDLGIYNKKGEYTIRIKFNTTAGKIVSVEEFDLEYDVEQKSDGSGPSIELGKVVDTSYYLNYLAYITDGNNVTGTVTLSIDGKQYYNKELDGTRDYLFIHDTDLEGFDFGDAVGNHTVKVTYNNLTEESIVSFVFKPYVFQPYYSAVGDRAYVILKATSKSKGSANLYNAVYNNSTEEYERGTLIGTYSLAGASSIIPLPALKKGGNVFCVNYTLNGDNFEDYFGIYAEENSKNVTSSISATEIGADDSLTVKVNAPKEGWIDFYLDGKHYSLFSLANGTSVEQVFSNLTIGDHVISVSYDGEGYNDLFYSKNYFVTVNKDSPAKPTDITNAAVVLSANAFTFNSKIQKPTIKTIDGKALVEGTDYTVKWSSVSSKNAGTYTITITGKGAYAGVTKATYKINKAANPLTVKAKTVKVKFSAVKKKAQSLAVSKVVTFSKKGQGTLTYAKSSGNKKITVNKKTGKVTVGKGLKKGTYKVKVKIKATGNANYKASAYKAVTFKIVIK